MIVFLDTEFTDLLNPELLSLGLVTLDGREHYAELDLTTDPGRARVKASSAFVHSAIFDKWGLVAGATSTEWEMGCRTAQWLLGLAVTAYFAERHPEHHALHDARAYRLGWLAWMDARKAKPC